jgi:hypothetical protein
MKLRLTFTARFMVRRVIHWDVNIMISCPQEAKEARVEGEAKVEWVAPGVWERVPLSISTEFKM